MRTYEERVYTRLMPSEIHGVGVFAIRPIPKDTTVFRGVKTRWTGTKLAYFKDELVRKLADDMCCTDEEGVLWLPEGGLNNLTADFYLNHSDMPNTYPNRDSFITNRPIKVGEELTIDYRCLEAHPATGLIGRLVRDTCVGKPAILTEFSCLF